MRGQFNLRYCGSGNFSRCRTDLWAALDGAVKQVAATQSDPDPNNWRSTASRTSFVPGLLPNTMRSTNRPTFQQVLEFQGR